MTASIAKSVIVVGAGIIGSSIAYRLTRSGADVTIVDAGFPGGVAGPCSFGWINATYGCSKAYFDLRTHSMREWERLNAEVDGLPYHKTGNIYVHFDRVDHHTFYDEHSAWGYGLQWLTHGDIQALAPNLVEPPEQALFAPDEAVGEAEETAQLLIRLCQHAGASTHWETPVLKLVTRNGNVVGIETRNGTMNADEVVLAAGAGVPQIAASAGIDIAVRTPPGLLIHTQPMDRLIDQTVLMKGLHVRQRDDGVMIAGADFGGGEVNDAPEQGAELVMDRLRSAFRGTENAALERYTVGYRPTPTDGLPVVGRPPNMTGLYVATMHSGVTLAPSVSLFACDEILNGRRHDLLQPFGLERFVTSAPI